MSINVPDKRYRRRLLRGDSYESRQIALNRLGFRTYAEYLKSNLWKHIRLKVYKAKGPMCFLCGRIAEALHHNRYHKNDLLGKRLKYINPICHRCHEKIEFHAGEKCSVKEARKGFRVRRNQRKREQRHLVDLLCQYDAQDAFYGEGVR